jgi:hypothetical protein
MSDNPFKIIEPREAVPENLKKEVMGSVKTVVLILRFVQLFIGDYTSTILKLYKSTDSDSEPKTSDSRNSDNTNSK